MPISPPFRTACLATLLGLHHRHLECGLDGRGRRWCPLRFARSCRGRGPTSSAAIQATRMTWNTWTA